MSCHSFQYLRITSPNSPIFHFAIFHILMNSSIAMNTNPFMSSSAMVTNPLCCMLQSLVLLSVLYIYILFVYTPSIDGERGFLPLAGSFPIDCRLLLCFHYILYTIKSKPFTEFKILLRFLWLNDGFSDRSMI